MPINKVSSSRQSCKQSLDDFLSSRSGDRQQNSRNKQHYNSQSGKRLNNNNHWQNNKDQGRDGNRGGKDNNNIGEGSGNDKNLIPIPQQLIELLKEDKLSKKNTVNFSLSFVRLMEWEINDDTIEKIKDPKGLTDQSRSILSAKKFCDDANEKLPNIKNELDLIHSRQKEIISKFGIFPIEIKAKLISSFISGLGAGHPNETGMILDRNTGCPFLPASSIKGVLRLAYAIKLAEDNSLLVNNEGKIDDKHLENYFGSISKRGQLVVLDAYPTKAPKIKLDIMNPHYSKYYSKEEKFPIETEDPRPIKFISVKEGTEFIFRTFFLPLKDESFGENDKKVIEAAFKKAFSAIGFGGKTAIGYGRFKAI
ncbi:MAG: type III-B CRISPR module RAMP protein Cmr6 [Campylobacteraceae bacterium]|jgi:CRISPR-associated protein Cmr6|nr:type III-B CRISPR module RAMP protein Cmr6 [Campylobacteraceae bacterium]